MANEAARVCIDAGDLETAETWYRKGTEMGLKEPGNQTHPKSLWEFRLEHALARIAARRGNKAEAGEARRGRPQNARRRPGDGGPAGALLPLSHRVRRPVYRRFRPGGGGPDQGAGRARATRTIPSIHCLLGMAYERLGQKDKAMEMYRKAYGLALAHNPPAAFARPFARKKLAM